MEKRRTKKEVQWLDSDSYKNRSLAKEAERETATDIHKVGEGDATSSELKEVAGKELKQFTQMHDRQHTWTEQ